VLVLAENGHVAEELALGEATRDGKPHHTLLGDVAWQIYSYRDAGLGACDPIEEVVRAAEERYGCLLRSVTVPSKS